MRKSAYLIGRAMTWPTVAHDYVRSFERARVEHSDHGRQTDCCAHLGPQAALPVWRLDHLMCLTDDTGMLQHAVYTLPNYEHGYCTDDNARALILMMLLEELEECFPEMTRLSSIYAAFFRVPLMRAELAGSAISCPTSGLDRPKSAPKTATDEHCGLWNMRGPLTARGIRSWAAELFGKALPAVWDFSIRDHGPSRSSGCTISSDSERRSDG